MPRPGIGICTAFEQARWTVWDRMADLLPAPYAEKVRAAGGLPLLLPPPQHPHEDTAVAELVDRLDGVIIAGGCDIDPASYGAPHGGEIGPTWPERDRFELELTREAVARDLPLLAVCRGMQVLNVAHGGTLKSHLPDEVGDDHHLERLGAFSEHEVRLEPGSVAARAASGERIRIQSHHHQGIGEVGEGLVASGWDVDDGTIEAIEAREPEFALGILWHPEEEQESPVIAALVEAAKRR